MNTFEELMIKTRNKNHENDDKIYEIDVSKGNIEDSNEFQNLSAVTKYLKEISKFSRLTMEEEKNLFAAYKNGDLKAKKKLIESNLRLVVSFAKQFLRKKRIVAKDDRFLDFIQAGNIGLIKAIENFDLNMNVKLSTYASYWIFQYMRLELKSINPFEIDAKRQEILKKIKEYRLNYFQENIRYPSTNQISKKLGFNEKLIKALLETDQTPISIYESYGKTNSPIMACLPLDYSLQDKVEENFYFEYINNILKESLPQKQLYVLYMRFGFITGKEEKLESIAEKLNITREGARQIELRALRNAKEAIKIRENKKGVKVNSKSYL